MHLGSGPMARLKRCPVRIRVRARVRVRVKADRVGFVVRVRLRFGV